MSKFDISDRVVTRGSTSVGIIQDIYVEFESKDDTEYIVCFPSNPPLDGDYRASELLFVEHAPKSLDDVSNEEWNRPRKSRPGHDQHWDNALSNEEIAQDDDAYQEMLDDAGLGHVVLDVRDEKFKADLQSVLADIEDILIAKNRAYGNSALEPVRIFSKADVAEQLRVRIDDKLSRLMKGTEFADEDTVTDLIGYCILLKIAEGKK